CAWHLYQLSRLVAWIGKKTGEVPDAAGAWGFVFDQIHYKFERMRKKRKRLAGVLKRFQESTKAMPDGAVVVNQDGRIEWSNASAQKFLGLRNRDVGHHLGNLVRDPRFAKLLRQGSGKVLFPSPVEEKITLLAVVVEYAKRQTLVLIRDVTEMQRTEQIRRDFVANVSHELRTPLTVISGYVEAMQFQQQMAPDQMEAIIAELAKQANRMRQIVSDLLQLARLEASTGPAPLEPVGMDRLIRTSLEEHRALAEEKRQTIRLSVNAEYDLLGNPQEMHLVVSNLLSNAIRYTPEGGEIEVGWHGSQQALEFFVNDNGVGIPKSQVPRVTERFYRVDAGRSRNEGGTGLGLSIVKHALDRHQATLIVESTPGQGSRFSCLFPASRRIVSSTAMQTADGQ
ncbi:phosphate regulon sensor histidine kinase PhoR, partial [Sedimenticola sp.]|uniref:phosphate regulon sensor histidine kinase PhoR n=1 Tax=Sedimenticola sp. TaxID=1940285 RepID=UPI003D0F9D92